MEFYLVTAEDLSYLFCGEVEVEKQNRSLFDVVDVCVNIFAHTHRHKAIVECVVETADYYDHSLCIFDVDNASAGLKRTAVRAFSRAMCDSFMHTKSIRVHWLHTSACLVAEVESALICPLRRAFDASVEAERFPIGIYDLQTT